MRTGAGGGSCPTAGSTRRGDRGGVGVATCRVGVAFFGTQRTRRGSRQGRQREELDRTSCRHARLASRPFWSGLLSRSFLSSSAYLCALCVQVAIRSRDVSRRCGGCRTQRTRRGSRQGKQRKALRAIRTRRPRARSFLPLQSYLHVSSVFLRNPLRPLRSSSDPKSRRAPSVWRSPSPRPTQTSYSSSSVARFFLPLGEGSAGSESK